MCLKFQSGSVFLYIMNDKLPENEKNQSNYLLKFDNYFCVFITGLATA